MPAMRLREPGPGDVAAMHALDRRCFAPGIAYSLAEIRAALRARGGWHRLAEDEAGLAGFILTQPQRDRGHVITVDVAPERRRTGLGATLLGGAEEHYRAAGARGMRLEVAVNNVAALAFYAHRGYTVVRRLPGYYAADLDGLLLRLDFASGTI